MKAKMTAVASALVIGLMLIGISYALWSKTLVINGKVMTGRLDAEFTSWFWNDTWEDYAHVQHPISPDYLDKRTYTVNIYPGVIDDTPFPDYEYLHVDIDHLYPCIWINIYFNITNTGTIPLKIQKYYVNASETNVPGDFVLTPNGLIGTQLEPNEYVTGDLHIHLNNSALQNKPLGFYYFKVYMEVVQWNEFDPLKTNGPGAP